MTLHPSSFAYNYSSAHILGSILIPFALPTCHFCTFFPKETYYFQIWLSCSGLNVSKTFYKDRPSNVTAAGEQESS